ncbi:MAG: hypothetical protein K6E91_01100 [Butyrivibrio sp.]|nr:hypothetical protein [Butyrivibrio sp.]
METTIITENNIGFYENEIPADVAENIGRKTYGGIAVHDEDYSVAAAMVWELKHGKNLKKPTISQLSWISARDHDTGKELFSHYGTMMTMEEAKKSCVELFGQDSEELTGILKEAKFSFSEKEGESIVVKLEDFSGLDIVKKTKIPSNIRPLGTLDMQTFRRGLVNCIFHTERELLEDIGTLPFEWYDTELSCYVKTDNRINGYLLVHKLSSGSLRVELLIAYGADARVDLLYMVRYAILKALSLYPKETKVILVRRDESVRKLTGYFFPRVAGESCLYGERDEL